MRQWTRGLALVAVLISIAAPAAAQAPGVSIARPVVGISIETDPMVECHFFLKTYTGPSEKPIEGTDGDLSSEAAAYATAKQNLKDPAAWRWFEDLIVGGPDPAAVRAAAETIPPAFDTGASRTALHMLLEAFESAYPKFMEAYWPNHLMALNRTLINVRTRYVPKAVLLEKMLLDRMGFAPIDAPIRVIGVIRSGAVSAWGKAGGRYYVVIGVYLMSVDSFSETALHEATHLIDSLQPSTAHWMLRDVRQALGSDAPAEQVDAFLHGLVAYNAGEIVRRLMDSKYRPVGIQAPSLKDSWAPFVPVYADAWLPWLDGNATSAQTISKLASGFKAAIKVKAPPAK